MAAIRGPSPQAQNLRAQPRSHMDRSLQPLLPNTHFGPTDQTTDVHLFVDGSSMNEDTVTESTVAGWGLWIPEANLAGGEPHPP